MMMEPSMMMMPECNVVETIQCPVTVFSISGCQYCNDIKSHLHSLDIPFSEIDVGEYPEKRLTVVQMTGRKTVPQVYFYNTHVGGFEEFQQLVLTGSLARVLQETSMNWDGELMPGLQPPAIGSRSTYDAPAAVPMAPFLIGKQMITYDDLINEMRSRDKGLNISMHRHIIIGKPNTFSGGELANWLYYRFALNSVAEGASVANELMRLRLFHPVHVAQMGFTADSALYRLQEDEDYPYRTVINERRFWVGAARHAALVAQHLRFRIARIYDDYTTPSGVDFVRMVQSDEFHTFVDATGELQLVDIADLPRSEKIACLINIYNTMVVHAFCVLGAPKSARHRYHFTHSVYYNIGGYKYSLNDIEHGLLRSNKSPPFKLSTKPFGRNDARIKFMVSPADPRVHFALNCGAKSCPPGRVFAPQDIDDTLNLATESFLERTTFVDVARRRIVASKVLQWYKAEFGPDKRAMAQFISQHLPRHSLVRQALDQVIQYGRFKLKYADFDWETFSVPGSKPLSVRQLKIAFSKQLALRSGATPAELAEWELIRAPEGEDMLLHELTMGRQPTPNEALLHYGNPVMTLPQMALPMKRDTTDLPLPPTPPIARSGENIMGPIAVSRDAPIMSNPPPLPLREQLIVKEAKGEPANLLLPKDLPPPAIAVAAANEAAAKEALVKDALVTPNESLAKSAVVIPPPPAPLPSPKELPAEFLEFAPVPTPKEVVPVDPVVPAAAAEPPLQRVLIDERPAAPADESMRA